MSTVATNSKDNIILVPSAITPSNCPIYYNLTNMLMFHSESPSFFRQFSRDKQPDKGFFFFLFPPDNQQGEKVESILHSKSLICLLKMNKQYCMQNKLSQPICYNYIKTLLQIKGITKCVREETGDEGNCQRDVCSVWMSVATVTR